MEPPQDSPREELHTVAVIHLDDKSTLKAHDPEFISAILKKCSEHIDTPKISSKQHHVEGTSPAAPAEQSRKSRKTKTIERYTQFQQPSDDSIEFCSARWDTAACRKLLALYKEKQADFSKPNSKSKLIWKSVAQKLKLDGYHYSGEACQQKLRNLKKSFKKSTSCPTKLSEEKSLFYEELEQVFSIEPTDESILEASEDQIGPNWTSTACRRLLSLYEERMEDFNNTHVKNKVIWKDMAARLEQEGYHYSADSCEQKLRNLKKSYKKAVFNNWKSGKSMSSCMLVQELEHLFGPKHKMIFPPEMNIPPFDTLSSLPTMPSLDIVGETESDKDALQSMLLSWYMTGYKTGHYQGLQEGKKSACQCSTSQSPP